MKFRNETDRELKFKLGGKPYVMATGDEAFVPDELGYAIEAMKLPLTCTERAAETRKDDAPEGADGLKARAQQDRARATAAEAQVKRLNDSLSELRAQHRKVLDEQAKTEAELRGHATALREDVKNLEQQLLAVTKDRDDLLEAVTRTEGDKKMPAKATSTGTPKSS